MALRNQPYIPLYVQDFLTDEKLIECSAAATGVYIRLMCILHKSSEYGQLLLKQKDKQGVNQLNNFALKLLKHLPYPLPVIEEALTELCVEGVISIEGDVLLQKRMIKDNIISLKRANAGQKGGYKTQLKTGFAKANAKANAKAKVKANSEYENEIEIENKDSNKRKKPPTLDEIKAYCLERGNKINPEYFLDYQIARDWKLKGGNKIKDWKAVIRTWEKNNFEGGNNGNSKSAGGFKKFNNAERGLNPEVSERADAITREYLAKKAKRAAGGS